VVNDSTSDDSDNDQPRERYDEMDEEEDFARGPWPDGSRRSGIEAAMRSIHNTITSTMRELRVILENLRQKEEPGLHRVALEDLAQILLMANEDTLAGHFSPDPYLKEIIPIMDGEGIGAGDPEVMLLACRCIANMMEALPPSTSNVVFCGAVPILCAKLRDIEYIDLAEQCLSVSMKFFRGCTTR
jgi:E3 ubiquitin-protein ligase TRIP12